MAGSAAPRPPVPRPGTFSGQKVLDMKLPLDFSPFITSPSFQSKQGEPQRSPGTTVTAQRPLSLFPLFLVLFPGPIQQDQGCPVWEGASCHLRVRSHLNSGCGRVNPQTSQGGVKQGGVRSILEPGLLGRVLTDSGFFPPAMPPTGSTSGLLLRADRQAQGTEDKNLNKPVLASQEFGLKQGKEGDESHPMNAA